MIRALSCDDLCRAESPAWFTAASHNAALATVLAKDSTAALVLFRPSVSFHEAFSALAAEIWMTERLA